MGKKGPVAAEQVARRGRRYGAVLPVIVYAVLAALWIYFSDWAMFVLAGDDPQRLAMLSVYKGWVFVAVTAVLLYVLIRHETGALTEWDAARFVVHARRPRPYAIVAVFAVLALAILVGSLFFARHIGTVIRGEKLAELGTVADLKAQQIDSWLLERRGDAESIAGDAGFAARARIWFERGGSADRQRIAGRLAALRSVHGYEATILYDARGRERIAGGDAQRASAYLESLIATALRTRQVQFSDLYREADRPEHIHLDFIAPLVDPEGTGRSAVGALVLRVNPYRFLFDFVQSPLLSTASGETVLLRRDRDYVLFLNELRHRKDSALLMRRRISNADFVGGQVAQGRTGVIEGKDYRDVPVLAVGRAVTSAPWFLVAKIDQEEIFAPIWRLYNVMSGVTVVLVSGAGFAVLLLWRQQSHSYLAQQRAQEAEKRALVTHFDRMWRNANDLVVLTDESERIVEVNTRTLDLLGYARDEMLGQPLEHFRAAGAPQTATAGNAQLAQDGRASFETVLQRRDGREVPIQASASPVEVEGRQFRQFIGRDLSELKRHEQELRALNERLREEAHKLELVLATTPDVVVMLDRDGRVQFISESALRILGRTREQAMGRSWQEVGLPPEAIEPHVRDRLKALRTRVAVRGEARFPTRLGERYFQYWINPVVDADGTVTATVTTATDVTERAEYERRIAHLNDIYATLSQTNETIVRIQDRDTLLQRICQIAVEHAHFRFAWIGLVDEEERRLKLVASAGEVVELLELADLPVNADDPRARGPTATAVREGRHQVCNDFQHADNTAPWHDVARRSRVGSSASFPIREQGRVVGALAVYAVEANYFDERLIRLLDEMATDIGFAFDNYHREALREQAERERRAAEQLFRGLVEQSIAGIYIVVDDRLEYVNPRFAEIHGYSPEEMAGLPVIETVAESGRAAFSDGWRRTRAAIEKSLLISYVARRKDGTTVHVGTHLNRAEHKGRTALIGVMQDISEKIRAEERIQEYIARLERAMLSTIRAISLMSELRDPYTYGHEQRVGDLAGAIAIEMGLGEEVAKGLRVAGYVHDIGKVVVPAEILAKPGRLTKAEFELIKAHPQQSYEILRPIEFPWPVALGALQHHERLDGSGYPNGAKGEEIALESRILAVADVVEAMSTHRPYRPAVGLEAALAEIGKQRGTRLDERAVDACVRLFREKGYQLPAVR